MVASGRYRSRFCNNLMRTIARIRDRFQTARLDKIPNLKLKTLNLKLILDSAAH